MTVEHGELIHAALLVRYPDRAERRAQINTLRYHLHNINDLTRSDCGGITGKCPVCYGVERAESRL